MRIILGGFAVSGKSSIGKILAERYGLKFIAGGDALKKLAENKGYHVAGEDWWDSPEGIRFLKEREKDPNFDKKVDKILIDILDKDDVVITSRTMPWLYKGKAIKIWIEASQETRADRMAFRDKIPFKKALKIIKERDRGDLTIYKDIYGYDITDKKVFDFVICSDNKGMDETLAEIYKFLDSLVKKEKKNRKTK